MKFRLKTPAASTALAGLLPLLAMALSSTSLAVDTDLDGIDDPMDNCTLLPNADQRDTDNDTYGNVCDADLNNDLQINFVDLGIMKSNFFTTDPDSDLDGDGSVNFGDLGAMKAAFFGMPGPSGVASAPKYFANVQPVLQAKCMPCHTQFGSGDHNIGSQYDDAFLPADDFNECAGLNIGQCSLVLIQSGEMPLGGGCSGDPALDAGNPSCLTQQEQDTIQGWLDAGLPE
ncbi:MAG: thrombospondin type 3 repeat-containing protein [Pseudomonadota bacterium]